MAFRRLEIPARPGGTPGITYVVTHQGVVIFTQEYTRHVALVERSPFDRTDIAWGGILTPHGDWVRRSFDFGDATTLSERQAVVDLIASSLIQPD